MGEIFVGEIVGDIFDTFLSFVYLIIVLLDNLSPQLLMVMHLKYRLLL